MAFGVELWALLFVPDAGVAAPAVVVEVVVLLLVGLELDVSELFGWLSAAIFFISNIN